MDTTTFCKLPHWLLRRSDLTMSAKVLWAYFEDKKGGNGKCWPGIRMICADLAMHPNAATRAARELERASLLTIHRPPGRGGRTTNRYITCASETVAQHIQERYGNRNASATEGVARCATESVSEPDSLTRPIQPDPLGATPDVFDTTVQSVNQAANKARREAARLFGGSDSDKSNGAAFACEDEPITGPLDPLIQAMCDLTGRPPSGISGRDRLKVERLLSEPFPRDRFIEIMAETKRDGGGLTQAVLRAWADIKERANQAAKAGAKDRPQPAYEIPDHLKAEFEAQEQAERRRAAR